MSEEAGHDDKDSEGDLSEAQGSDVASSSEKEGSDSETGHGCYDIVVDRE